MWQGVQRLDATWFVGILKGMCGEPLDSITKLRVRVDVLRECALKIIKSLGNRTRIQVDL
jgi:hypothetical protein